MLSKICPHCNKEIIPYESKYCDECKAKVDVKKKQDYKRYKANRIDIKEQEFYVSNAWKITRQQVLTHYKGIDVYQYYISGNHSIVYTDMVHHIVELKDDWSMRVDFSNLIPMSNATHQLIHTKLYPKKKEQTQRLLRQLIQRWSEEFKI